MKKNKGYMRLYETLRNLEEKAAKQRLRAHMAGEKYLKEYYEGSEWAFRKAVEKHSELFQQEPLVIPKYVAEWFEKARMYTDEYADEDERYYVIDEKHGVPMLSRRWGDKIGRSDKSVPISEDRGSLEAFKLTEQEIKNYDERYWAFAIPVEEAADRCRKIF